MKSFIQFIVEGPDTSLPGVRAKREGESSEEYGSYLKGEMQKTKQTATQAGNKAKNLGTAINVGQTVKGAADIALDVSGVGKPIKIAKDALEGSIHLGLGNTDQATTSLTSAAASAVPVPGSGVLTKALGKSAIDATKTAIQSGGDVEKTLTSAVGAGLSSFVPGLSDTFKSNQSKLVNTVANAGVNLLKKGVQKAPGVITTNVAPVIASATGMPRTTNNQPKV